MRDARYEKGFTIIEVLFAIILIGIAIASLVAANISFTKSNAAGTDLSTAEFLAEQVKEEMNTLDYDDLDDFNGVPFPPPFSRQITVENVNPANFEQVIADHGSSFVRINVKVFMNSREISSTSWIRARY